jgi:DNA repair protein SbcC/Rad50
MFLEKIILEGFLSYKKRQEIDLTNISTCLVLGQINGDSELSNGAGKSSLFEAVLINFFGKGSGRSDVLDSYIIDSMSKMYLELIFKIDKQRFKTVRSKKRTSSAVFEMFVDINNKELDYANWKKIDKTIEDILGLSSKTYCSTIYLNERDSLKIINGTSSDRKEILRELLDIEIYEKASKACSKKFDEFDKKMLVNLDIIKDRQQKLNDENLEKQRLLNLENKLEEKKQKVLELEESLININEQKIKLEIELNSQKTLNVQIQQKQKEIDNLSSNEKKITIELNNINQEVLEQKNKFKLFKEKINKQSDYKKILEKEILEFENKLKLIDDSDEQLKIINNQLKILNLEITKLNSALDIIEIQKRPINELLIRLQKFESVCPITLLECSILNKDYKNTVIKEKQNEIIKLDSNKNETKDKIKKIDLELSELNLKESQFYRLSKSRQGINENITKYKLNLQSIINDENIFVEKQGEFEVYLQQSEEDVKEFNKSLIQIQKNILNIKDEKKKLELVLDSNFQIKLNALNKEIVDFQNNIKIINKEIENYNQDIGQVKNSLELLNKMKLEIEHLIKNNEDNISKKRIYQTLTNSFGKDGIQKTLMKEAVPLLEKYTLEFLKIFNDESERIKVKFDLDPKRQDGEYKKGGGLDILVIEDEKEAKDLQMYSGGETVRIVFSIVLALAKLLSLRAGKKHESLIIDEKIAKLDSRGIEQFGEVIREVSKIYKQVFVITHIESLKDMFNNNQIIVNKTEEGSKVTVS